MKKNEGKYSLKKLNLVSLGTEVKDKESVTTVLSLSDPEAHAIENEKDTNLLEKLNNIIKAQKSKVSGKKIEIYDVQGALHKMFAEHYSVKKIEYYQSIVDQLTTKKVKNKLNPSEAKKLNNATNCLREQEYTKEMLEILKQEHISSEDAAKVLLPFADPTLDVSFKMLFGQDENSDILISLLIKVKTL